MKLQERYERYLIGQGWQRCYTTPQSTRYRKYYHPNNVGWYWLGKAGAIRFNLDNNVTYAYSNKYEVYDNMVAWEGKNGLAV